ncbi:MAG: hypothetical protein ACRDK4_14625 [Solirubrobacteraceae bacterium]
MLRKSQLGRFGSITLGTALAAVVVGAVWASSALAVGGPLWVVKGAEMSSEAEKETLKTEGGQYTLTGTTNIVCETVKGSGEIIGGNPGRDLSTITFEKCHVQNKASCLAASAGFEDTIQTESKSVLVYPLEKEGTGEEALDAFTPDNGNTTENLFVEFTLKNASGTSECLLLNGVKVDVIATGTLVSDPSQINKKCGILAHVGALVGGSFSVTKALEESLVGALNATGTPEEAAIWKPVAEKLSTITCKLEAFGPARESGLSDVLLVSEATFGWAV